MAISGAGHPVPAFVKTRYSGPIGLDAGGPMTSAVALVAKLGAGSLFPSEACFGASAVIRLDASGARQPLPLSGGGMMACRRRLVGAG